MIKIKKIALFLIMFLSFINVAKAARSCADDLYARSDFDQHTGIIFSYKPYGETDFTSVNYHLYNLKDANNQVFSSYCRQAGKSAGKNEKGDTTFKCEEVVFDVTDGQGEEKHAYDAGVIEILKNGYSTKNPGQKVTINGTTLTNNEAYAATTLALRVYEMYWPTSENRNDNRLNSPHKAYANFWLGAINKNGLLSAATNSEFSPLPEVGEKGSWKIDDKNVTSTIEDAAYNLVVQGLTAAKNYRANPNVASLEIKDGNSVTEEPKVDENGKFTYKHTAEYNVSLKNFKVTDPTTYVKLELDCPDCSKYGIKHEIFINDVSYGDKFPEDLLKEQKLSSSINNGTGDLKVKIVFTVTEDTYSCQALKYSIKNEFKDPSVSTEAYNYVSDNCNKNSCQNFYVLYANNTPITGTYPANGKDLPLCKKATCEQLRQQCNNNPGSDYCTQFQNEYGGQCASCTTYVGNAVCTDSESDFDILEGYEAGANTCVKPTTENIKSCIINSDDINGNSYQDPSLVQNTFCSVWCKEDYHVTVPGIQNTSSLRQLDLNMGIKGKKTCYLSLNKGNEKDPLSGDPNSFEYKYEKQRQVVIRAYNNYQLAKAAVSAVNKITNNPVEGDFIPAHTHSTCAGGWVNGKCTGTLYTQSYDKISAGNYNRYEYTFSFGAYDPDEIKGAPLPQSKVGELATKGPTSCTVKGGMVECEFVDGDPGECNELTHSCPKQAQSGHPTSYYYDVAAAETTLKQAIEQLKNIVDIYNSCMVWEMDYNYDPVISFDYSEEYMKSGIKNVMEPKNQVSTDQLVVSKCFEDTNKAYDECKNYNNTANWGVFSNANTYEYEFGEYKFVCDFNSCKMSNEHISKIESMKESISVESEYILPSQYYNIGPHGGIILTNDDNIENSSLLEHLLPIGNSPQSIRKYALIVEKLGEYYGRDELGRIWGADASILTETLNNLSSCSINSALEVSDNVDGREYDTGLYVCKYKVNLPEDDPKCPNCPVVCITDNDCYYDDPKCPHCPVTCPKCLYNDGLNVENRPITPDNINPNDRDLGANWNSGIDLQNPSANVNITTAMQLKAYATVMEIQKNGELIYNVNFEDNSTNDFAVEVNMDSQMIAKVKEYNSRYENDGGYASDTLACYDYKSPDGTDFKNVYCYSTFIDELLYDSSSKDKIKIKGNRIIGNNVNDTDNQRRNYTQSSGYWTTWDQAASSQYYNDWNIITTTHSLSYFTTKFGYNNELKVDYEIGPSWK